MTVAQTWWALWLPSAAMAGPRVSQTDSQTHWVGVWVRAKGGRAVSKCQGVFMDERWGEGVGRMTWHPRCRSRGRHFFMSRLVWIQRNHIQAFCFCEVFSVVTIFATAQPQLMGKTKTARARSMARWSCVRRTPPYTYCLCDEIKKEKKLSKMSRVITKEIQFTATQGCQ